MGIPHSAELGYIFDKKYHNSSDIQNVGSECVGAMILGYGRFLYRQKTFTYDTMAYEDDKYTFSGEEIFTTLSASARIDNIPSNKILTNFGFNKIREEILYGEQNSIYELDFSKEDIY